MADTSLFSLHDGRVVASALTRGPWSQTAEHGGAPAALVMGALEALPTGDGLALARVTYELMRPVPVGELALEAGVVRPGRRVQLLEATLRDGSGTEVLRARALRVARAQVDQGDRTAVDALPSGPEDARPSNFEPHFSPMFTPDAIEVRFLEGGFGGHGDATAWFRLRVPVTDASDASPLQRLAAAADFGNGISSPVSWNDYTFVNPDLTIYIEREPAGEWIGLRSRTRIPPEGIGLSESVLYDERGRVGQAVQSLLVLPR
jgi:hypothetical protein